MSVIRSGEDQVDREPCFAWEGVRSVVTDRRSVCGDRQQIGVVERFVVGQRQQ
jgi:hypothetical protein